MALANFIRLALLALLVVFLTGLGNSFFSENRYLDDEIVIID
jgi:hypothetical protein